MQVIYTNSWEKKENYEEAYAQNENKEEVQYGEEEINFWHD